MTRTSLEMSRAVARSYRSALHSVDPDECARLDAKARELGERWITPTELPAHLVEHAMQAELPAKDIEHFWGIPAATIRTWDRRGLLERRCASDGSPVYLIADVLAVEARNRARDTPE